MKAKNTKHTHIAEHLKTHTKFSVLLIANVIGKRSKIFSNEVRERGLDVICGNDDVVFYYQVIFHK